MREIFDKKIKANLSNSSISWSLNRASNIFFSKNEWPKISVITPSFNQGEFLEDTIISVLSQNYPNLEYIVIDGGSTDHSIEIIKKYESKISFWVSEKDEGLYHALQKGFEKSTGDIMMWINSDDMLHSDAFRNIVSIFSQFPDIEWITGINVAYDEIGRVINAYEARKFSKYCFLLNDYKWIQQESTVWKRSLWEKAGGYVQRTAKLAGDLELWLRFIQFADLYPCNILIGGFRIRTKNQLTLNKKGYHDEAVVFLNKLKAKSSKSELIKLFILRVIVLLSKILKFSFILDLRILRFFFLKSILFINRFPSRIIVDTKTCLFVFEQGKINYSKLEI